MLHQLLWHLLPSSAHLFLTVIIMPQCLRDCVLVPVPKKNKDATCSVNYRPIALSSCLSK